MRRKTNSKVGDVVKIRPTKSGHRVLYARLWGSLPEDPDSWRAHEPEKYCGKVLPHEIAFVSEKHSCGWFKILTSSACGWISKHAIEFAES